MNVFPRAAFAAMTLLPLALWGAVVGAVRGRVEDPAHRPVADAAVVLKSSASEYFLTFTTNAEGAFEAPSIPVGVYQVTVKRDGFAPSVAQVVVASGSASQLLFELKIGAVQQEITIPETALAAEPGQTTPVTMISRREIQMTPGADLSNSLASITDYVPGAWVTHDQLHVRGGHQVTWAIDGVAIPNTNIASNVGPQIDPKDIDYLEVQRGGYSAQYGDRSYGVFNVIPRTGFEKKNQGELFTTFGTFHQTNDQLTYGTHTERFAYFGSVNGNRSDYGLQAPGPDILHDRAWGLGGTGTLMYTRDTSNQFRLIASTRRDDYQIPNDPDAQASGMGDVERERDALTTFSWIHTFRPSLILTLSPFYHGNRADYDGGDGDPLQATQHRASQYAGGQAAIAAVTARHNASAGIYAFAQRDSESIHLRASDEPGLAIAQKWNTAGHLEALFLEDQFRVRPWLTLTAGVRLTHFAGAITENAASPRVGGSIRIPHLHWVLRGFWGRYYQAPPLSTVTGPILGFALTQGVGFIPLRGENDEERQFGLTIPYCGWAVDVNNYRQHARNYFDHNALGNSNIFFPLTIDRARLSGWELSIRSPQLFHRGEVYLSYANARAEASGAISGGLTDFAPAGSGYFLLDHDQRHTLHAGFNVSLPRGFAGSANAYYGSGFTDGSTDTPAHLAAHTTFDLSIGKSVRENLTVSVTAMNVANRRFLLDNSRTFGGTHYADPRQIYVQLRYRFRL